MCTFINKLPKNYDLNGMPKKKRNLQIFITPTEDKVYYRFRILSFAGVGTTRNYPFIQRFTHVKWGKTDEGKPCIESQVVCPVTPWVTTTGNKYDSCPICKIANQHFLAFKESGWKSRTDAQKQRELSRKFEAIIPVYVVNDPVYPGNNNKFKVIIFNDKEIYKTFLNKVEAFQSSGINVFNGEDAVDCCIHMSNTEEVRNEGLPNEYRYTVRKIDKIIFTNKPYTIEAITKEAIDKFDFDETYYQASTQEEIDEFYKKYCIIQNDDIPDEDIPIFEKPKISNIKSNKTNSSAEITNKKTQDIINDNNITAENNILNNDLIDDDENLDLDDLIDSEETNTNKNIDVSTDDIVDTVEENNVETDKKNKQINKNNQVSADTTEKLIEDDEDFNLDDLLNDLD